MIYRLIKLDPAWKYVPVLTLCAAVAGFFATASGGAAVFTVGFVCAFYAVSYHPQQHATGFEGSLPIAGRQLFLARVTLPMAILWLPAVAGGAASLILSRFGSTALLLVEIDALCTLGIMTLQWLRMRGRGGQWFTMAWFIVVMGAWGGSQSVISDTAIPTLGVCVALSAALFVRIWRAIPKAFQIAPAALAGGAVRVVRAEVKGGGGLAVVWLPILRSVFAPQHAFLLPILFYQAGGGDVLMWCFWLTAVWRIPRQRLRWARALPVSPRVVLWIILGPVLLAIAGGYILRLRVPVFFNNLLARYRPGPPLRDQVLAVGGMVAWALLVLLFNALADWRGLRHFPAMVRKAMYWVPIAAVVAVFIPLPGRTEIINLIPDALSRLSAALPGSLAAAIAMAAITLGAIYWALERVFEEAEYTDKSGEGKDGWTIPTWFNRDAAVR